MNFRWVVLLLNVGIMLRFLYWAALEVGYGLSLTDAPLVGHDWLFFAFLNSGFYWGRNVYRNGPVRFKA